MSGFYELKEVSNAFLKDLHRISQVFEAGVSDSFEDGVLKKTREITLFTSKLRLLRSYTSVDPNPQGDKTDDLNNYEETAVWNIIEQKTVKSVMQTDAVNDLLTTPNESLDQEMLDKKLKIKDQLTKYSESETELRHLYTLLKEKQNEHIIVQSKWDQTLKKLRDIKASAECEEELDTSGSLYQKLHTIVDKLELMRWLLSKLVIARSDRYDWLADPHGRYSALKMSREVNTIEKFVEDE
ncbi:uncharacterized protein [Battus philenor]|uniref:uncharacterized protein isoform X2 n=1 Tax=Battus philenor TaxID=42288 RepID=UPI0035D04AA2